MGRLIDLFQLQESYLGRLQSVKDELHLCLIALDNVAEADLAAALTFPDIQVSNDRDAFDLLRARSKNWLVENALTASITITALVLDQSYAIERLIHTPDCQALSDGDIDLKLSEQEKVAHGLPLPIKMNHLANNGVDPLFSQHVRSINRLRNCLAHRDGVVGSADVGKTDVLTLRLRSVRIMKRSVAGSETKFEAGDAVGPGESLLAQPHDKIITYKRGERIALDRGTAGNLVLTLSSYVGSLFEKTLAIAVSQGFVLYKP